MLKNMKRKILATILSMSLISMMFIFPALAVESAATVVASSGTAQPGITDWGTSWTVGAGNGMEMILTFSKDFTAASTNSRFESTLSQFITVNGVSLADRIADPDSLGVSSTIPAWLWGTGGTTGSNTVMTNLSNSILQLRLIGGGTGNLNIATENTIVIDSNFPLLDGSTMGSNVTMTFDPATLEWTTSSTPAATPTDVPVEDQTTIEAASGSAQSGISDWSGAWGVEPGKGMEMELIFSKAFTNAAMYTSFSNLEQYITINDVNLVTRVANDPSLGIANIPSTLWGGNNTVVISYSGTSLHIILIGGGTGNLDITYANTIVIDADFPFLDGTTLGRDVTLKFNPLSLTWAPFVPVEITPTPEPTAEPTIIPTEDEVSVDAGAGALSGQLGICDWSGAWGVEPGEGMEVELNFSKAYNNAAMYTSFSNLEQYITVNGVNLVTRAANDPSLGIADIPSTLWGGNNTVVQSYSGTSLHIILIGGGTGNLDITYANTIVIDADFPFLDGTTLGRDVTLTFDPATLTWGPFTPGEITPTPEPTAVPTIIPTEGDVCIDASAGALSGQLGICDWSGAWGVEPGNGMELELIFSKAYANAAMYTSFPDLEQYITVNGINLATRAANDPSLGIADIPSTLWGGNNTVLSSYSATSLHIILVGGGTGNLDITYANTIVIDAGFPFLDGTTLGRDVTLTFDPATLIWVSSAPLEVTPTPEPTAVPTIIPVEGDVYVEAGAGALSGQLGMCDWSSAWGVDPGKGMEIELLFTGPFTDAAMYTRFPNLAQYITINGVNLADRLANDPSLGIDAVRSDLWEGHNTTLLNYSPLSLHIVLVGGGTGNLDIVADNTVVISADFPLLGGSTLGREITLTYDPEIMEWSSSDENPDESSSETSSNSISRSDTEQLSVSAGTPSESGQDGIWDRSAEWGLTAGKGMEVQLVFSGAYTDSSEGVLLTDTLAPFITINGVNLGDRANFEWSLGMDEIRSDLFNGSNVVLTNNGSDRTKLSISLLGGGTGNLDKSKQNTIVLSADFPLPGGLTLGREITLTYNPNTKNWTSSLGTSSDNVDTGDNMPILYVVIIIAILMSIVTLSKKYKINNN